MKAGWDDMVLPAYTRSHALSGYVLQPRAGLGVKHEASASMATGMMIESS